VLILLEIEAILDYRIEFHHSQFCHVKEERQKFLSFWYYFCPNKWVWVWSL